jgi:hypothetical protein
MCREAEPGAIRAFLDASRKVDDETPGGPPAEDAGTGVKLDLAFPTVAHRSWKSLCDSHIPMRFGVILIRIAQIIPPI